MMLENLEKYKDSLSPCLNYNGNVLSYKELNERIQALAWHIKENFNSSKFIGIYGDKENDMIITMLACLIVKKTFVTLSTAYPKERLNSIVKECDIDTIVNVSEESDDRLDINVMRIKSEDIDDLITKYKNYPYLSYQNDVPDKTAFVLFTSGSTGKPKGVEISHQNLEDHIVMDNAVMKDWDFDNPEKRKAINVASYAFVAAINSFRLIGNLNFEILSLPTSRLIDANYVFDEFVKFNPAFFAATPSFIKKLLLNKDFNEAKLGNLKRIVLAGEPLYRDLVLEIKSRFSNVDIVNIYGSTETAGIGSLCYINDRVLENNSETMPVDDGTTDFLKIYDENMEEVTKENVIGELYFSKKALSKGYYHNELLTKDVFYTLVDGTRLYKTGDLGYIENGYKYVSGRIDNQIKIGGNRIELEDIEANLLKCSIVKEAGATVRKMRNNSNSLACYIVLKDKYINNDEFNNFMIIKNEMKQLVEPYKIPQKIVFVDNLPKNVNGKLDRSALSKMANQ